MVAPSVLELVANRIDVFLNAAEILIKFADRILCNQQDVSCRSIRVSCEDIAHLLPVRGAIDCLFTMGFEEAGEYFRYPVGKDLELLLSIRNEIYNERKKCIKEKLANDTATFINKYAHHGTETPIPGFIDNKHYPHDIKVQEKSFYSRLMSGYRKSLYYEDCALQERARECIPLQELQQSAEVSMKSGSNFLRLALQDFLLMELAHWFKNSFFSWVDQPPCDACGGWSVSRNEVLVPCEDESMWDASSVESYTCKACAKQIRFPRYNHPLKLLETRKGRCGEWANCFTLLCRALRFEARFVEDWTDHVWTEVYSVSQNRWIHVDPCEADFDHPLVYEAGWNKKLSYVIAYSHEEIVDVTWRYSSKHREVLSRRLLCRERWLLHILKKMNNVCQSVLPPERKAKLLERKATEVAEFLCPRSPGADDNKGRSSGSLTWRLQRGETGKETASKEYVFRPTSNEIDAKKFHLQYSSSEDFYRCDSGGFKMSKWESGVFSCENISRKVERDWNMVYLARAEGTNTASIMWKCDFRNAHLKIKRVKVLCETSLFENGNVTWVLSGDEVRVPVPTGNDFFETSDLMGSSSLTLKAELSLGKGECAWQHTQLFRQSTAKKNSYPLDLLVTFL